MPITKKSRDQEELIANKHFDVWQWLRPPPEKKLPLWKRWLQRFKKQFKQQTEHDELSGRFAEMTHAHQELIEQLRHLYTTLEEIEEQELYVFRETVVASLLREGETLQKLLHNSPQAVQVKAFSQYNLWSDRSSRWLASYAAGGDQLHEMIRYHIVRETIEKIMKDQQLIDEYLSQALMPLGLSPLFYSSLHKRIKTRIATQMHQLEHLKNNLEHLQLGELNTWKSRVNSERQRLFEAALDDIDQAIEEVSSSFGDYQQEERKFAIMEEIASIERLYPHILSEVNKEHLDEAEKELLLTRLKQLKNEAYRLSLDLCLPEEGADRLQTLQSLLDQAQYKLIVHP